MYRKLMLAYDGSACAELALREAAQLMTGDMQMEVVTVAAGPSFVTRACQGQMPCQVESEQIQKAEVLLEQAARALAVLGVGRVETLLIDQTENPAADVARALMDEAGDYEADLIVMGTHGRQGFMRVLLGSVADRVVRESTCPVLLVRGRGPSAFRSLNPAEIYEQWPEDEHITPARGDALSNPDEGPALVKLRDA